MVGKNNTELVSVKIVVELETLDNAKSILGNIDIGHSVQFFDGEVELKLLAAGNALSFDGGFTAELLLSFSVGVASGVVGNFIFASLCDRAKKLTINGRRTRMTEENITQVIELSINAVLPEHISRHREIPTSETQHAPKVGNADEEIIFEVKRLSRLRDEGVLTEQEYEEKRRTLVTKIDA